MMNVGLFVSRFGDYLQFTGFVTWVVIFIAATYYAIKFGRRAHAFVKGLIGR